MRGRLMAAAGAFFAPIVTWGCQDGIVNGRISVAPASSAGAFSLTAATPFPSPDEAVSLSFDSPVPNWESQANGLVEAGLIAVRLDTKDRCQALLSANGNDVTPQPLTLYRNRRARGGATSLMASHRTPDWYSDDIGYHMTVAAGRVDRDDIQDVVVGTLAKHPANTEGSRDRFALGGVKVYSGIDCGEHSVVPACRNAHDQGGWHAMPATSPTQVLDLDAGVVSVALGDVNGDGRLDLAIAMFTVGPKQISPLDDFKSGNFANGDVRVYLNEDGRFAHSSSWSPGDIPTDRPFHPAAVKLADVDQDGLMDLVVGSDHAAVYFGLRDGATSSLERKASWNAELRDLGSVNNWRAIIGLDASWLQPPDPKKPGPLAVAAALGCPVLGEDERCTGGFALYSARRGASGKPTWTSRWTGSAFHVKLADVDEHDRADLVVSSFWGTGESKAAGGGLRIFRNTSSKPSLLQFEETFFPPGAGARAFVGEGIAVVDLDGSTTFEGHHEVGFDKAQPDRHVYTVPALNVEDVVSVERTNAAGNVVTLRSEQYASASGGNWVSLASPLVKNEKLKITYLRSAAPDVAVGTFNGDRGILYFQNNDRKQLRVGNKMCDAFRVTHP